MFSLVISIHSTVLKMENIFQNLLCFKKLQEMIRRYCHTVEDIVTFSGLELLVDDEVNLYGLESADKKFLVLKKVGVWGDSILIGKVPTKIV